MQDQPHIYWIRKGAGIAGQFPVTARIGYVDEAPREVTFTGSVYGGPVVMQSGNVQTFVTNAARFGTVFGVEWVRRFFGALEV